MTIRKCQHMSHMLLALAGVWLAGAAAVYSQPYSYISGVITDASGGVVPGCAVTVVNEDSGFRHTTVSQADGTYTVSPLNPGAYMITVRKLGFRTSMFFGAKVQDSRPIRVDFKLVVGSITETVTVEGSAPLLERVDASVGTLVGRDQIENLPLSRHNHLDLFVEAPGVVVTPATHGESGQFSVGGQRPNTNYFTVDGVGMNSGISAGGQPAQSTGGTLPAMTAFGSLESMVSTDAIQEVRVQTSSTTPTFGRMPGAQISFSSRAGSNEIHGSLAYSFRNQGLDANNWFANAQGVARAPLSVQNGGATLGGPIVRNRTFFFVSYERLQLTEPLVLREPVPSMNSRATSPDWTQPLLNLFAAPNGPPLSNGLTTSTVVASRPSQLDAGAVRIDQAITPRLSAFGRYSNSPSSTEFGINTIDALAFSFQSGTVGLNWRPGGGWITDFRANYLRVGSTSVWEPDGPPLPACALGAAISRFDLLLNNCDYLLRLSITGAGQVTIGSEGERKQSQVGLNENTTLVRGPHSIQFGADFRRLGTIRSDDTGTLSIIGSSVADFADRANLWWSFADPQHKSAVLQEVSVYGQDVWRIASRLTLTVGLRWEVSPPPSVSEVPYFLRQDQSFQALQRPIWQSAYANFAPRFGVAFRPTRSEKTVIRAGGGLYFDSSLSLATDLINDGPLNVSQYNSSSGFFKTSLDYGFLTNLRLPVVKQWNVSIEQALNNRSTFTVGYIGSSGDRLVRREIGPGSTDTTWHAVATNNGISEYHQLLAQFRRRLARGVQGFAAYSWSHSIDNSSTDSGLYWSASPLTPASDWASSDFDIRHSITAGFTLEAPATLPNRWFRRWTLDGMFRARTGFPINILNADQYTGVSFENIFRPNRQPGQDLWITDANSPGGRLINPAAFQAGGNAVQGNLGRNALSGFGMSQVDLSFGREFLSRDSRSLQIRVEAFNALNHPNFGDPVRILASPLFGQSTSMLNVMLGTGSPGSGLAPLFQAGGARSLQVTLRFKF